MTGCKIIAKVKLTRKTDSKFEEGEKKEEKKKKCFIRKLLNVNRVVGCLSKYIEYLTTFFLSS